MSGFLYFIPGGRGAGAETLEAAGLGDLLNGLSLSNGQIDKGPGGVGGVLIRIDKDQAPRLRYAGDTQVWRECAGGKFSLGYDREHPPTPRDLARPDLIDGHSVILEDGNKWLIPVARVFQTGGPPVFRLQLGPDDQWIVGEAIGRLRNIHKDAESIWSTSCAQLQGAGESDEDATTDISLSVEADIAERALAVNYLLSRREIDALGLFSSSNVTDVALALVDFPTIKRIMETQKKTDEGNDVSSPTEGI